LNVLFVDIFW